MQRHGAPQTPWCALVRSCAPTDSKIFPPPCLARSPAEELVGVARHVTGPCGELSCPWFITGYQHLTADEDACNVAPPTNHAVLSTEPPHSPPFADALVAAVLAPSSTLRAALACGRDRHRHRRPYYPNVPGGFQDEDDNARFGVKAADAVMTEGQGDFAGLPARRTGMCALMQYLSGVSVRGPICVSRWVLRTGASLPSGLHV